MTFVAGAEPSEALVDWLADELRLTGFGLLGVSWRAAPGGRVSVAVDVGRRGSQPPLVEKKGVR